MPRRFPALAATLAVALVVPLVAAAGSPTPLDQSTPRRALRTFVDATARGDYAAAASVLDLRHVPEPARPATGPRLARELAFVLECQLWIDWDRLSDEPRGDRSESPSGDVAGTLSAGTTSVPLRLVRAHDGAWRIGAGVVSAIPRLYQLYGPGWLGDRLPPALIEVRVADVQAWQWIGLFLGVLAAIALALGLGRVGHAAARALARRRRWAWDERLAGDVGGPARLLVGAGTFALAVEAVHLSIPAHLVMGHLLRIVMVSSLSWAALRGLRFAGDLITSRAARHAQDETAARARVTQVMVLRRIAGFAVVVFAGSIVLMQFDALRTLGTSLLASAGVAGVVVGLAAQRSLASVFAGIQISLTQPIRVGDVVTIESESGVIEEITLTYVVVRIWDLRRMIVPITRFVDSPFQNWTRSGTSLIGTARVHVDYGAPVDEVRRELARFVATRPEWDGKVASLEVSDATDRGIQLSAIVSSADADRNGALRAAVREHLVRVLQTLDGGRHLPRTRIEPGARERPHDRAAPADASRSGTNGAVNGGARRQG